MLHAREIRLFLEVKVVSADELRTVQSGVAGRVPIEQTNRWERFSAARGNPLAFNVVWWDDGKPVATGSFYENQVRGVRYLWARRGPVWFRQPSPSREAAALTALRRFVEAHSPSTAFLRLHAWYAHPFVTDPLRVIGYDRTAIVDGGRGKEEAALAAMPSVGRKLVRRARSLFTSAGGTIQEETGLDRHEFSEHYALLRDTAQRDGFTPHEQDYYWDLLTELGPEHARLFTARVDGQLACWDLVIVNGHSAGAFYGASSALSRETRAAVLLDFEVALQMGDEGRGGLDLMGVHSPRVPELYEVGHYKMQFVDRYTDVPGLWDLPVRSAVCFGLRTAYRGRQAVRRITTRGVQGR